MDKLDIHEFLRIYLPGLFLSSAYTQMSESANIDNAGIATVSIFVGLIFAHPAMWLSKKLFDATVEKQKFWHSGKDAGFWET